MSALVRPLAWAVLTAAFVSPFASLAERTPSNAHVTSPSATPGAWGFALGMYPQEAHERGWTYPPDPDELLRVGARDVLLTPTWSQHGQRSAEIARDAETPRDADLVEVMRTARRAGLRVSLMPYLRVRQGGAGVWRGTLRPRDEDAWWASYEAFIQHYARLAVAHGVHLFVIGSELSSMSTPRHAPRWRTLAQRVRGTTHGALGFVLNHDAMDLDAPLEFVDVAGVSAYFPLGDDPAADWRAHAAHLEEFATRHDKPLVLFELGFPSRRGALERPWDHVAGTPVDTAAQAQGYQAATDALRDAEWLDGVFFWAWYGEGGPYDRGYSPRDKPAEAVAAAFLRAR